MSGSGGCPPPPPPHGVLMSDASTVAHGSRRAQPTARNGGPFTWHADPCPPHARPRPQPSPGLWCLSAQSKSKGAAAKSPSGGIFNRIGGGIGGGNKKGGHKKKVSKGGANKAKARPTIKSPGGGGIFSRLGTIATSTLFFLGPLHGFSCHTTPHAPWHPLRRVRMRIGC